MADIISRLKLESSEFDSKIRRAVQGLQQMERECHQSGASLAYLDKEQKQYVQALGQMQTVSTSVRGKINELTQAYTELSSQYRRLSNEEKKGDFGKALSSSLDQLKQRIKSSKEELNDINKSLGNTKTQGIDLGSVMQTLGAKFGISTDMMGMMTTGTIAYTAAIGAAATAVAYATKTWAEYNSEIAKQQQVTTVTTGLKGSDAAGMTGSARAISKVYGTDFREVINAANTLMTQFGQTGDEAIQLLRDGMQGMIQGDGPKLLQMIQQYAPAFRDAGVSASQLIAVIQNSEGGIFTDQNMNAIVMGIKNIRLMTTATSDALAQLGIDGQKMSEQLGNGTLTVFDALKQVATAIENTNSSSQAAGQVMQQVFGRQGAMAGTKLGEAIATLNLNLDETKKQTGDVGESLASLNLKTEEFEKRLMSVFGIDGWDTMNNQIKEGLLVSLNKLLVDLEGVRDFLDDINIIGNSLSVSGMVTFFADIAKEVYLILNPLMEVVRLIGYLQNLTNQGRPATGSTGELTPEERKINELASRGGGMTIDDIVVTPKRSNIPKRVGGGNRTTRVGTTQKEIFPEGSIAALNEEIKDLQKQQQLVTDTEGWKSLQEAIDGVTKRINAIKGVEEEIDFDKLFPMKQETTSSKSIGEKMIEGIIGDIAGGIQDADTSTLKNLLQVVIENGLQGIDIPADSIMEKILGDGADIPDEYWQSLQDEINAKLKELGIEPIKIDFKTGNISKDGEKAKDSWKDAAKAVQSVGAAMQNIEDPAAKVAGTVMQAVANVALGYANALTMAKEAGGPWGWIAFAATGLATMMTTISAIHSATGYAQGGIVDGRAGGFVGGTAYSGDNVGNVRLDSGELVLNRAQQSNLANALDENPMRSLNLTAVVSGEQLLLVMNRTTRRQGKGELLTFR